MKNIRFFSFFLFVLLVFPRLGWTRDRLSLEQALSLALGRNPSIAAYRERARAEDAAVSSAYSLMNPRVGFMREVNVNLVQVGMGPMDSWMIGQEILFPTKYFLLGSAQKQRAQGAEQELSQRKLEIRHEVISTYFGLYAAHRTLALLQAQKETLREIARIAEARRATGAVPQQDEMKAHVEQTMIENEIIIQEQQIETLEARLSAVMNQEEIGPVEFPREDIPPPEVSVEFEKIPEITKQHSRVIRASRFSFEEAEREKRLAYWGFAPDFMLGFRKPFRNAPEGAYSFTVEMSVPLWFFMRQSSEVSEARARTAEAERNLEQSRLTVGSEVKGLIAKVRSYTKVLKIYQTALIPQATSTHNSSRAAYSAGRTGFLELLDSERSLYQVRIGYYRMLSEYVESLTRLEQVAGASLSTLPFGEGI